MAASDHEELEQELYEYEYDEEKEEVESVTDISDSDDSEDDPNFEIDDRLSNLSIKNKPYPRIIKGDAVAVKMIVPELDEKDQKSFDTIQKIIDAGNVEKLKVEECKVYLRKHGLRLTGKKDTLIVRIKEHHDIVRGSGESKYPASSFVLNCKGDACTGDVVMFEQNVYEMFSIASRSATGPPCGTRVVAGRIVKESYGAAKQQHTFTIEVLWSKGEKPLPPLHPLLIKGRNLYRLKTMRQRWEDEGERQKKLMEKHTRGYVARLNRETRIQEKKVRKMLKENRVSRIENQNERQDKGRTKKSQSLPVSLGDPKSHVHKQGAIQNTNQGQKFEQMSSLSKAPPCKKLTFSTNLSVPPVNVHQRQPLTTMNYNPGGYERQYTKPNPLNILFKSNTHQFKMNFIPSNSLSQIGSRDEQRNLFQRRGPVHQKKLCPYYPQGRCYYGDRCKYLHENIADPNFGQRRNQDWPSGPQNHH